MESFIKNLFMKIPEMKEKRERDGNAEKSDQICISVSFCFARGESGMFVSSICNWFEIGGGISLCKGGGIF